MQSSVMVPAVRSCSATIMRRLVIIVTETLFVRAALMADNTGGDVKLGLKNVKDFLAVEMRCRRRVFRGVGGGAGAGPNGRKKGNLWCGEGRRVVGNGCCEIEEGEDE